MADFLSVGIDASDAQRGAQEFARATDKISNSAEEVQRELDRTQRKMNEFSAIRIKDPGFANSLKNLDRDFEKKLRDIDRQLGLLESGGTKAAKGMDTFGHSTRRAHSAAGQFIEQIAQGDIGGVFGEIAQAGGPAGAAIVGIGLAAAGAAIAIGAITKAVIENVREIDALAKEFKLTSTQIQALQVAANVTGQSVDDLAENYKKIQPQIKQFDDLVKKSGAAIDADLRGKTQDAALAFEELKLSGQGALNAIARESLPTIASLLRDVSLLIRDLNGAWTVAGQGAAGFASAVVAEMEDVARIIGLLNGKLGEVNQTLAKIKAGRAGSVEAAREELRSSGGFLGPGQFSESEIDKLLEFGPERKFTPRKARKDGDRFNIPFVGGSKGSNDAAQEAKRLFDAQIQLERAQSKIALDIEKRRIAEQRDLIESEYEDRLTTTRDFFAEKILLQQQETRAEIRHQEELRAIVERQQERAKKPSEKLALADDLAKIQAEISRISDEGARVTNKISRDGNKALEDDAKKRGDLFKEYAAALRELSLTYQELSEGSLSTATERFKDQYKAIYDLMKVVSPQQAQSLRELLALISGQDTKRRDIGEAGRRFDVGRESLALEEDKINRDVDKRVISEERGIELLKDARKRYRDVLLQELDTKIALLETIPGMELEIVQLERQKVAVEQLGTGFTKLQKRIQQFGQAAKNILQDAFYQGIVEGPRAFFQTLLQGFSQLLAQLAAELLTSQFVKLLGNLGQGAASGGGGGGGFLSTLLKIGGTFLGSLLGGGIKAGGAIAAPSGSAGSLDFAGFLGGLGRASGGYVDRAGVYNVGELGMERVFLPRGAYVQDNYEMRMAAGGQPAVIQPIIHVHGVTNPQAFQQNSSQIGAQIRQALQANQRNS